MRKIICGFAGIGKSYLAKHVAGVVDLESTPFNKIWSVYVDVAEHMANNGYTVLLSCHKELRDELKKRGVNYAVAIPRKSHKSEYIKRYTDRLNTENFVNMFEDNFEKFIDEIEADETNILYVEKYLKLTNQRESKEG